MARLRTDAPEMDGRPPIPKYLRQQRDQDWLSDEEVAQHRAFARTATVVEVESAAVDLAVRAYRRWRTALHEWGEANGYTVDELRKAVTNP